jgi:hypothetical protein
LECPVSHAICETHSHKKTIKLKKKSEKVKLFSHSRNDMTQLGRPPCRDAGGVVPANYGGVDARLSDIIGRQIEAGQD